MLFKVVILSIHHRHILELPFLKLHQKTFKGLPVQEVWSFGFFVS